MFDATYNIDIYDSNWIDSHTDKDLIDTLKEFNYPYLRLGFIPSSYKDCIKIDRDIEGNIVLTFDMGPKIFNLLSETNIKMDELKSKLLELTFMNQVFDKIYGYRFYD